MKFKSKITSILMVPLLAMILTSTSPVDPAEKAYEPILMERSELNKSIKLLAAKEIDRPGKLYIKGDTIYLIEKFKGVHIIDNSNHANPQNKGYINIPGIVDISIKNNSLFADNATDLVSVDLNTYTASHRIENVFPEITPPGLLYVPYKYSKENRPANTVIVNWVEVGSK